MHHLLKYFNKQIESFYSHISINKYEYLEYHTNSGFDETHKISSSKIISSSSGDQEGHPYSYAFDGSKETSWISNRANDDTFLGSILANFTEPI